MCCALQICNNRTVRGRGQQGEWRVRTMRYGPSRVRLMVTETSLRALRFPVPEDMIDGADREDPRDDPSTCAPVYAVGEDGRESSSR